MVRTFLIALSLAFCLALPALADEKAPLWSDLNAIEKTLLTPVAGEWNNLAPQQRKMLRDLTERYPKMPVSEQQRVQARIAEWAALTPEQREAARENFNKIEKLPPEKREAMRQKWEEYQKLTPEERQKLRGR